MLSNNPRHFLVLAWGIVFFIITFSILPGNNLPKYNWQHLLAIDKLGHFACYGLAAWSFLKYFKLKNQIPYLWHIGISLFLLGVALEVLQSLLERGRKFDLFDIFANSIGIYCGLNYFDLIFAFIRNGLLKNKKD